MKTVTIDILNDHAFNLLKDLEKLKVIRFKKDSTKSTNQTLTKKVSFQALNIDTTSFKFDRAEANER
ncbi:hypothetical protein [Sphingobacterium wenxiniae]|uniref:Uncharacterized protein n=1 Tax=Sphingobacterium wenxiniae TaxID=683125 RepID=A0A1I6UBN2_9SPHI|nr:hypothetical protein [Sphingobacterium wenxiniae]SFS98821.1 hypothetical protein SAMN05660206_108111 [Sphingobacterium wenxiniae]